MIYYLKQQYLGTASELENNQKKQNYFELKNQSRTFYRDGNFEQADSLAETCMKLAITLFPSKNRELAEAYRFLGITRQIRGKMEDAIYYFQHALAIYVQDTKEYAKKIVGCLNNLALIARERGEKIRARHYLGQALAIAKTDYLKISNELSKSLFKHFGESEELYDYSFLFDPKNKNSTEPFTPLQ